MWNKAWGLLIFIIGFSLLITTIDVEARGGGGGGRGGGGRGGGSRGGGGAYRGGKTMNRTPTMSRASNKPAVSQPRQAQVRQAASQGRVQPSRQTLQQRSTAANRTELRSQINQYAQSRPAQNIDRQALSQKAQNFSSQRSNQIAQNRQVSERVSQRLQQTQPGSNRWFDRDFFDRHNIDVDYIGTGANWWRAATWSTLAGWGAWSWSTPYYYDDDGYAYPITVTESTSSYPYSSSTMSSQSSIPTQTATTAGDWLPLGVFAVTSDSKTATQSNHFIQLAVNRSGEIAGVLYNSLTDAAHDLTGMVDPNSQKAYWYMANKANAPISSTGIYNLTEDQTSINVHFSDGSDQPWTLVRLKQGQ